MPAAPPLTLPSQFLAESELDILLPPRIPSSLLSSTDVKDEHIAELLQTNPRELVFFDETLSCFLFLRHPRFSDPFQESELTAAEPARQNGTSAETQLEYFLEHLEIKAVVSTVDGTQSTAAGAAPLQHAKRPSQHWYANPATNTAQSQTHTGTTSSTLEHVVFWKGSDALCTTANVTDPSPESGLASRRPWIPSNHALALIPLDLPVGPMPADIRQRSGKLHLIVSVQWKPPVLSAAMLEQSALMDQRLHGADSVVPGITNALLVGKAFSALAMHAPVASPRQISYPGPSAMLPLRRTVRKAVQVGPPLSLQVYFSDAGRIQTMGGCEDQMFLSVELENTTTSPWMDVELDHVDVAVRGCIANKITSTSLEFPLVMGNREQVAVLYRLTALDPLRDGSSHVHSAQQSGPSWLQTMGTNSVVVTVRGSLLFRDSTHASGGEIWERKPLQSRWKCSMRADGIVDMRQVEAGEVLESNPILPVGERMEGVAVGSYEGEGVSIAVHVEGNVVIHRIFTMQLEIVNRCNVVRNLALVVPNSAAYHGYLTGSGFGVGEQEEERWLAGQRWSNKDKSVAMRSVGFLEMFDDHQRKRTSFLCLESNLQLP